MSSAASLLPTDFGVIGVNIGAANIDFQAMALGGSAAVLSRDSRPGLLFSVLVIPDLRLDTVAPVMGESVVPMCQELQCAWTTLLYRRVPRTSTTV
jgi:hypothetical protein